MFNNLASLIPYLVLLSHILLAGFFLALLARKSWGRPVAEFLGERAVWLGLLITTASVLGSLLYSEIIGFEPCVLCWWQRAFLYPVLIIFVVALWKKLDGAFSYAVPLAILAGLVSLYQAYGPALLGESILPCLADEGECAKVYVKAFGYITIPVMSLTVSLYILLLAWANKIFKDENSNA